MGRSKSAFYQQKKSEQDQLHEIVKKNIKTVANNPAVAAMLGTVFALLNTKPVGAETQRRFSEESTDVASVTNANITTSVSVSSNAFSQANCPVTSYYSCATVTVSYVNASTGVGLGSFGFGLNLASTLNNKGQQQADQATLAYAEDCLQTANTYLQLFSTVSATAMAQIAANQVLPCGFTTQPNNNMVASFVGNVPTQLCNTLQGALTGIIINCERQAVVEAAKLYGLIALVAIPVIAAGIFIYCKCKTGSFIPCCSNENESSSNAPTFA